jgi:Phage major capsid protein E
MALWTELISPAELTGYARAAFEDYEVNQASLAPFLPNAFVPDIVARIARGENGMVDAATFRAYDAETAIGGSRPAARLTFDLPPLGKKERVSEYDQLRARNADSPDTILSAVERVTVRRVRSVADRIEYARGQLLTTGKVIINEGGFISEADFGRAAGHTVTAATAWTDTTNADPLSDLDSWCDTYRTENGQDPGAMLISSRVFGLMMRATKLRALTVGGTTTTPSVVSREAVRAVLAAFGLPPIVIYDRKVNLGAGAVRPIPDDRVLLLPSPADPNDPEGTDLGATFWGTTLEASDPRYGIEDADYPGIVAGTYRDDDVLGIWVRATAIAMPAMANANLSFVADVAA